jgi:hypothetical protein
MASSAARLGLVAEDKLTQAILRKCVAHDLPNHQVVRSDVEGGRGSGGLTWPQNDRKVSLARLQQ